MMIFHSLVTNNPCCVSFFLIPLMEWIIAEDFYTLVKNEKERANNEIIALTLQQQIAMLHNPTTSSDTANGSINNSIIITTSKSGNNNAKSFIAATNDDNGSTIIAAPTAPIIDVTKSKQSIRLLIDIVSAWDLRVADILSQSSDPFVIITLGKKEMHRTKYISKT